MNFLWLLIKLSSSYKLILQYKMNIYLLIYFIYQNKELILLEGRQYRRETERAIKIG
jgi:hypothetical protein